jgi:CotH kinase protein/Lamin Tail Domain/Secretion system C-terminal sorting domain
MKLQLFFAFATIFGVPLNAQQLPSSMRFSADGRMLLSGKTAPGGLYDSTVVRKVYLDFPQTDYWQLLTQGYQTKVDIPAKMTVDGVVYNDVGVRFKGQTSYRMNNTQKKSFNITMDHAVADQNLMGYKTLNFNAPFQDASNLREIFYQHRIRRHVPAAASNFVHLYLNGQDWGPYANVQQLNKTFLKEWFFSADGINWRADRPDTAAPGGGNWGDGTAALNYLGADTSKYKLYYTLKSSGVDKPWNVLVETTNALNNTPMADLPKVLPDYIDVDRTLWFLACEIAFADDDSYVFKGKMDYYLYYDAETGRMTPIEYDGNSAMKTGPATSWGPFYNESKANYPLLNKLLAVPAWRQRYLAHLRTLLRESLDPETCAAIFDNYKNQISALVQADPKRMTTYAQFESEINVLKNFVANRRNYLMSNAEVAQPAPDISDVRLFVNAGKIWEKPASGQAAHVTAKIQSTIAGVSGIKLYYSTGLTGGFSNIAMLDDGQHHDGAANDGVYGAELPARPAGTRMRFYIEAAANNPARAVSYRPVGAEHDVFVYQVDALSAAGPVAINEIMAVNTKTVADEKGAFEDWIELYNNSDQSVNLSGWFMSDNPANLPKFELASGTTIGPKGYLVFWADEDGVDGPNHCNFKLSAAGEVLFLLNPALEIVDSLTFGPQTSDKGLARVPNGTGKFVVQAPTYKGNNNVSGLEDVFETHATFQMSPNPAKRSVYLDFENYNTKNRLIINDISGKILLDIQPAQRFEKLDVSQWPAGIYAVRYGKSVKKLVVAD